MDLCAGGRSAELRPDFASGLGMGRDPGVWQEFTQPIDRMGRQPFQDILEVGAQTEVRLADVIGGCRPTKRLGDQLAAGFEFRCPDSEFPRWGATSLPPCESCWVAINTADIGPSDTKLRHVIAL